MQVLMTKNNRNGEREGEAPLNPPVKGGRPHNTREEGEGEDVVIQSRRKEEKG